MDSFFREFETTSLGVFKRFPEEQKERINELFIQETADAQAKLEAEALKKWEEDKKAEEAKTADDLKKGVADPKAKKAAPPAKKGGKDADKPNIDVPKIPVPGIEEFKSEMNQNFVIERSYTQIAEKLMKPAPSEEEENNQDADKPEDVINHVRSNSNLLNVKDTKTPEVPLTSINS